MSPKKYMRNLRKNPWTFLVSAADTFQDYPIELKNQQNYEINKYILKVKIISIKCN